MMQSGELFFLVGRQISSLAPSIGLVVLELLLAQVS